MKTLVSAIGSVTFDIVCATGTSFHTLANNDVLYKIEPWRTFNITTIQHNMTRHADSRRALTLMLVEARAVLRDMQVDACPATASRAESQLQYTTGTRVPHCGETHASIMAQKTPPKLASLALHNRAMSTVFSNDYDLRIKLPNVPSNQRKLNF